MPFRIGTKGKLVDRAGRYDDDGRALQFEMLIFQTRGHRACRNDEALRQRRMPMGGDFPQIFAAAGLDSLDMQRVGVARRRMFTIQRETRDPAGGVAHAISMAWMQRPPEAQRPATH